MTTRPVLRAIVAVLMLPALLLASPIILAYLIGSTLIYAAGPRVLIGLLTVYSAVVTAVLLWR